MAAYPNLRQRDHVENVFSIGSNPIAATTPGYPNQQRTPAQTRCVAGANPVPGTTNERARSTKEVQPHDKRPTRGSTPPARTKRSGRPSGRSTALQAERRGFNSRPLHLAPIRTTRAWPNWQRQPAQTRFGRSSNLRARTKRTSRRHSVTQPLIGTSREPHNRSLVSLVPAAGRPLSHA